MDSFSLNVDGVLSGLQQFMLRLEIFGVARNFNCFDPIDLCG